MSTKNEKTPIESEEEFHEFLVSQGLKDYSKIPVEKVKFSKGIKIAFWFLRIYIAVMIVLVLIGFSHVI
ncbi:MAG: hypothetical protein M1290_05385 [Candidatus Thermoplasmatota archaeon]|jgi:hypothetical protein|nr:hypothetical protein [Candidatus Thermoplasmatota archaeon]MCL5789877.1 hypothetical protein [Candidatus Thermoplasmatota archaeon]